MHAYEPKFIKSISAIHDHVIVGDMNFDERVLSSGLVLLRDDSKTDGIRPRWAKVIAVGPDQTSVKPGQWVLIEHGRWSRGVKVNLAGTVTTLRRADPASIMAVSNHQPKHDDTITTAVYGT